jgi:excisionase family DNA binding protein
MLGDFNPTEWITTSEAAKLTGYTASYFRKALKRGLLQGQKWGRGCFLNKADVLTYATETQRLESAKHDPRRTVKHSDSGKWVFSPMNFLNECLLANSR